jgi:hypothetical protein
MASIPSSSATSTEPPSQLQTNLAPVPLKYIPLPSPLPTTHTPPLTLTASPSLRPPCRRCLLDAQPGEALHLLAYDPFPADSVTPYRGTGPIFVHAHDCGFFRGTVLPERQLRRQLSLRAYDARHMMVAAEVVVEGAAEFEGTAGAMLADERAAYVNVHNAKPGCFAVRVERA